MPQYLFLYFLSTISCHRPSRRSTKNLSTTTKKYITSFCTNKDNLQQQSQSFLLIVIASLTLTLQHSFRVSHPNGSQCISTPISTNSSQPSSNPNINDNSSSSAPRDPAEFPRPSRDPAEINRPSPAASTTSKPLQSTNLPLNPVTQPAETTRRKSQPRIPAATSRVQTRRQSAVDAETAVALFASSPAGIVAAAAGLHRRGPTPPRTAKHLRPSLLRGLPSRPPRFPGCGRSSIPVRCPGRPR